MAQFYFSKTKLSRGIISLGISCLSLVFMIALGFYANDLHQQIEDLKKRLLSLNHQASRSQEAATLVKTHREDFAAFEACRFEHPITLETFQNSFSHALEFGPISFLEEGSKNTRLVLQEVTFSIPCLQDRDIFVLIDRLINHGPGIFQIQDVTINRVSSLNEEMLEKIAAGKPQTLFDGKITATWIHR